MLPRWTRAVTRLSKLVSLNGVEYRKDVYAISRQSYAKTVATLAPAPPDSGEKEFARKSLVNLDRLFLSRPGSLALPPDSPVRVEEPKYEGFRYFMLKFILFYSKQSKSIRGANVIYRRITSQVDKPAIYEVFNLEKTFKMTFSLLVLHMWLCLRRMKEEGKEGVELGQYLYEIYNHDVELRVSKAGVNLLLTKWMKELEKIFYGNIVAYDAALLPELNEISYKMYYGGMSFLMMNIKPDAMARYIRREITCLSLTDKETVFSGNFMFTSLENMSSNSLRR
ncbi:ubiquinol-cytochrome-c reductase complex assembly factor 1 [Carica papaya]|uniref:ubiquinol-cytochrome-c reductase complex assembly factor 1 n=1 Tax=Carica papaya TaxID=3649 RepID=UPI000B8CC5E2|nr:ubiquinol-cytochrome-c reductase complex assembly factor 1 [Carica papaya]